MTADSQAPGTVALVTVHRPDEAGLRRLIGQLHDARIPVVLYVDGPVGEAAGASFLAELRADKRARALQGEINLGIGAALNRLMADAAANGFRRALLLDQDSEVPDGLVAALSGAFDRLEAGRRRVALVGARPVAPPGEAIKVPRAYERLAATAGPVAIDYAITSGSLVSLDAWRTVGPFCEDYFIDAIDLEWCFRARRRGYEILFEPSARLPHRIGAGVVALGPIAFPRQAERRMVTYVRNQAHMLRLAHVPVRWKLRTLIYVPAQASVFALRSGSFLRTAGRLAGAALDGLRGRLGPVRER